MKYPQIVSLYEGGMTCPEIGKMLDMDRANVFYMLKRRGCKFRPNKPRPGVRWAQKRTQVYVDMHESGMTVSQIADALNRDPSTVRAALIRRGVLPKCKPDSPKPNPNGRFKPTVKYSDSAINQEVAKAVKDGIIPKGACEECGNTYTVAHHDDYNFPLQVRWLCYKHHFQWHQTHQAIPKIPC